MDNNTRIQRAMETLVSNVENADITAKLSAMDKAVPVNRLSEASGISHFNRRAAARSSETSLGLGA